MPSIVSDYSRADRLRGLSQDVLDIMSKCIELRFNRRRPTVKACFQLMQGEIAVLNETRNAAGQEPFKVPTFYCFGIELALAEALRRYEGGPRQGTVSPAAEVDHSIAAGFHNARAIGPTPKYFGEEVTFETMFLDAAFLGLPKLRFAVCVGRDDATSYITALTVSRAGADDATMKALQMTMREKSYRARRAGAENGWQFGCMPEAISFGDEAFINRAFLNVAAELGILAKKTALGMPRRPVVETLLMGAWPPRSLPGVRDTNWSDLDPDDHGSCLQAIEDYLVRVVCDRFNMKRQANTGFTAQEAAAASLRRFGVVPPPTPDVLRIFFGTEVQRQVKDDGVHVMGRVYSSLPLMEAKKNDDDLVITLRFDAETPDAISWLDRGLWHIVDYVGDMPKWKCPQPNPGLMAQLKAMPKSFDSDGVFQG